MKTLNYLAVALGCLGIAAVASAQQVISAKSGLVNYIEGKVLLDGKPVELKFGNFPSVHNESELRTTGEGRAEVLLGPGAFLRMGESSAFKMVSNRISDTRLEFLAGSMIVECAEFDKDQAVTITYRDATLSLVKKGLYRVDSEPARLMVYDGEAKVTRDGQIQSVAKSKLLALSGVAVAEKFDNKDGDSLYRWARRRSEYLAVANISAARSVSNSGLGFMGSSGWAWNPFYGTYTFLPMSGIYNSFWGYSYWSPSMVYMVYVPSSPYFGARVPTTNTASTTAARAISATSSVHSGPASGYSAGRMSSGSTVQPRSTSSVSAAPSSSRATR